MSSRRRDRRRWEITKVGDNTIVRAIDLKKWFPSRKSLLERVLSRERQYIRAVNGISFEIHRKEIFGLVGESGCGKTTTGRVILRLIEPTSGEVYFGGREVFSLERDELKKLRREMQMIFQDPYDSLSSRMTVYDIVSEPLKIHKITKNKAEKEEKVAKALESAGLTPLEDFVTKHPHELSGGQQQRVGIARALIFQPKFIVADEPVSMLDVSIKAGVLNLLQKLRDQFKLSCLFITHDISIAWHICDNIAVMYLGKIVENGPTEAVIKKPMHPYTKALMSVVPTLDPTVKCYLSTVKGEIPNPIDVPPGCSFHPRCQYSKEVCRRKKPEIVEVEANHYCACHLVDEIGGGGR